MPFRKITPRSGISSRATPLLQKDGWSSSNYVRFRGGLAEVQGGWIQFGSSQMQGVCRGMTQWGSLSGTPLLAAGTNSNLYVTRNFSLQDITPVVLTTNPTNPFSTVNLSTVVTVVDPGSVPNVGSSVTITGGIPVGGITLSGPYVIQTVLTSSSYTITAAAPATSTATGGGSPVISYLLPIGLVDATTTNGWGGGTWGQGTWGTPRSGQAGFPVQPRTWTMDHWGQNLVACPRGGSIYTWVPGSGYSPAVLLTGAPTQANGTMVSAVQQVQWAWGCAPPLGGSVNPMLLRFSDVGDNTDWVPTTSNQAGSFPLSNGSQIMGGLTTQQADLFWTDTALYAAQYVGYPDVWGFIPLATACGAISPACMGTIGAKQYWMSNLGFWIFDGVARPIDCPVWDLVYRNINTQQVWKIDCGVNSQFGEISWFYPSASSQEIDTRVTFNTISGEWWVDPLSRSYWLDAGVFGLPIAADPSGVVWFHETGYNAGAGPLPWFIETGYFDLDEGESIQTDDQFWPDQILSGTNAAFSVTVFGQYDSASTPVASGPYTVTAATEYFPIDVQRTRQLAVRFDNTTLGTLGMFWRNGAPRIRFGRDGRQ